MQKTLVTFLIIMLSVALFSRAEDSSAPVPKNKSTVLKKSNVPTGLRPHAPSNQFIVMSYDAEQGICTFELPEDVSFITVEFTETETDWTVTETAPATDPVIHVTLMPATYTVTCTTDNGSVYRGEFSTTDF